MKPTERGSAAVSDEAGRGVRYQSTDVRRAVDFYTKHLGSTLEHQYCRRWPMRESRG
jgi:hypothetical protein